jgi:nucleotide-binding universal stress UspA family protein
MLAIKHILFPVDFSERSCGAAHFVRSMATRFGAKITLISALPPLWQTGIGDAGATIPVDMDELHRDLEARLSSAFVREFDGIQVQRVVEIGDPAAVITRFAHTEGADLIMMPTHGYGPFRSLLLGSVTAKVLHDAECPVWTATHVDEPLSLRHMSGGNLLCAVDGTPKSVPLVAWAAEYARITGATLQMVHAVSGFVGWPERQLDGEFQEKLRTDARASIDRLQRASGVALPLCVGVGEVAGVVREEAERHDSHLILIGRGILHETMGRLRTHSYGIIRHAPCPVLSV